MSCQRSRVPFVILRGAKNLTYAVGITPQIFGTYQLVRGPSPSSRRRMTILDTRHERASSDFSRRA